MLNNLQDHKGKKILIPAVITESEHRTTRKGDPFGTMYIEDYRGLVPSQVQVKWSTSAPWHS